MNKNVLKKQKSFFIVRNLLGKFTFSIDTTLLGPFLSLDEARKELLSLHSRIIEQHGVYDDIECTYISENVVSSKIETDVVIYTLEIFPLIVAL